jgi:LuxR family maltose regulon positive regulatory protein
VAVIQNTSAIPTLIQTKFHRPRPGKEFVQRARLLKLLNPPQALTLVTAPAGYGKTTLLSSWLGSNQSPHAWLTLDERDNDFYFFVKYFLTALRRVFPSISEDTMNLFDGGTLPSQNVIKVNLINNLAAIRQDYILVLDDYHLIHNNEIHEMLTELVRLPPETMHLVIIARSDPALPLNSLRARTNITEIRAADLRFTSKEATFFLRDAMQLEANDDVLSILYERTEGWPAGLRLTGLYLRHFGDSSLLTTSQLGSDRYTMDYLANEVLAKLPEKLQDFLIKTSILDRICNPLCESIIGEYVPVRIEPTKLEQLVRFDLFLTPLDNIQYWYRYHHLFQQLLREKLRLEYDQGEIASLHSLASAWLAQNGYVEEALQHSLAAGDTDTAVRIVAQNRCKLLNDEHWQPLDRWVRMFSREVIDQEPELLLSEVWFHLNLRRGKDILPILDHVDDLLLRKPESLASRQRLMGEVEIRRSMLSYFSGDISGSMKYAKKALGNIPPDWWMLRAQARLYLSVTFQAMGDLQLAFENLNNIAELENNRAFQRRMLLNACFIHWLSTDLTSIGFLAGRVLETDDLSDLQAETTSWSRYFLGLFHYERGNLVEAERYLLPIVRLPYQSYLLCFLNSAAVLALAYQAMNQPEKANETVNTMVSISLEIPSSKGLYIANTLQAELGLRQGRLAEAIRWAQQNDQPVLVPEPFFYHPPLTLPRILIAQDTSFSRQKAGSVLSSLYDYFTSIHNTPIQIEVLVMQALLQKAENNELAAMDYLEQALTLTEPGNFIRVFVDQGFPMERLLRIYSRKKNISPYLKQILAIFPQPSFSQQRSNEALLAPLSQRELEVLVLLDKRYSDKEISDEMSISIATVRSHCDHIGEKLGVRGRRSIVKAANDQGLL